MCRFSHFRAFCKIDDEKLVDYADARGIVNQPFFQ